MLLNKKLKLVYDKFDKITKEKANITNDLINTKCDLDNKTLIIKKLKSKSKNNKTKKKKKLKINVKNSEYNKESVNSSFTKVLDSCINIESIKISSKHKKYFKKNSEISSNNRSIQDFLPKQSDLILNFSILAPNLTNNKYEVIYQFNDDNESFNNELAQFIYPFDKTFEKIDFLKNQEKINEIIFKDELSSNYPEFFQICLRSNLKESNIEFIKETNPELFYHYYCLELKDFILEKDSNNCILVNKILIIQTIFPLTKLFYEIFKEINNNLNFLKIDIFCKLSNDKAKINKDVLEKIELKNLNINNKILNNIINDLFQIKFIQNEDFRFKLNNKNFLFKFPKKQYYYYVENYFAGKLIFTLLSFENFMFILLAILFNYTIIFISEKHSFLSSAVSAFSGLLKPMIWPFPIIYSLPENSFQILEAPINIISGLKMNYLNFINNIFPKYPLNYNKGLNIYVFLDIDYLYYKKDIPHIFNIPGKNFIKSLKSKYYLINNKKSNQLNIVEKNNKLKFKNLNYDKINKTLCKSNYTSIDKPNKINNGREIFESVKFFLEILLKNNKILDLKKKYSNLKQDILEIIDKDNNLSKDKAFWMQLIESQNFMNYIE